MSQAGARASKLLVSCKLLLAEFPRPLKGLLAVVAVFGVSWALVMPPWQSPDAFTHYSYTESLATRLQRPGTPGRRELSSSAQAADIAVGAHRVEFSSPEAKPSWNPAIVQAYRAESDHLSRSDGGGPTPSSSNPPLYYAYAAVAYRLDVGGNALDRLLTIQLAGVLLLLATTAGGWLLAGEVFGHKRLLQLITAAVAGLQPMATFMSTSVNPDALLIALWTWALWLGTRVIGRGARRDDVTALGVITAAAVLTKGTSYALLPPVALAIAIGWHQRSKAERQTLLRDLGPGVAIVCVVLLAWLVPGAVANHVAAKAVTPANGPRPPSFSPFQFLDYLWQFYLPRLPGQALIGVPTLTVLPWPRMLSGLPVWNIWIREGWGAFGWLDVYMTGWVYVVLAAVTATIAAVGLAIAARFKDRIRRSLVAFFGLTILSLLGLLHVFEYRWLIAGDGAFIQGRYALPVVALFGLGVALIVSRLPAKARGPVGAVVVVGLLALQVLALATVAKTYYT